MECPSSGHGREKAIKSNTCKTEFSDHSGQSLAMKIHLDVNLEMEAANMHVDLKISDLS